MKKVTVIGDSHAESINLGLREAGRLYKLDITSEVIVYKGVSAYNVDFSNLNKTDLIDTTVLLVFGECDIRRHLPKYKNAEVAVERYVNSALNFFDGLDIMFMQPIPQTIDPLTHEFRNNAAIWYTFEHRMAQQENFYKALNTYDQKVIDTVSLLGTDHLRSEHTDDGCHLRRSLSIELGRSMYNAVDWNI